MTAVWRSLAEVPSDFGPTVVTLGNFDGVHRGHQAVLQTLVADARAAGCRSVAVTFDPHPRAVHRPDSPPTLVTGVEDRVERLAATGLDAVIVIHYTLAFAHQTPEEFVRSCFVDGLRAATVVIGHDTTFGWGNVGHADTMRELGAALGFEVEIVEWAGISNGSDRRWSSTWVRELLEAGDVAGAARILGRPHRLRGEIVPGDALGREIGFPTANLDTYAGMIPAHGVYAGWVTILEPGSSGDAAALGGQALPAAVSLGVNTTVGGTELHVEAHLIDIEGVDLYGARVALDLVDRRRDMQKFGSIEELTAALAEDVTWCREVLGAGVGLDA
ncbi:MAG TPA: bifunctional riboflavin kinase/FAD synthetase [Demequinaceae bacterium]